MSSVEVVIWMVVILVIALVVATWLDYDTGHLWVLLIVVCCLAAVGMCFHSFFSGRMSQGALAGLCLIFVGFTVIVLLAAV